jgi:hypothetical protein
MVSTTKASTTKMNLVKYAGDFWVTLADYTQTRDTKGYSNEASVKSAVRTFVVRQDSSKYISFRGESPIKNIIQENKNNPLFRIEDFEGHTRTGLIHWSMLGELNERFPVKPQCKKAFSTFSNEAETTINEIKGHDTQFQVNEANPSYVNLSVTNETKVIESRSLVLRSLRMEYNRLDKEVEVRNKNKEKILQAINSLESLELEVQ